MLKQILILSTSLFISLPAISADLHLEKWSRTVFLQLERDYGSEASLRMLDIYHFIHDNHEEPLEKKLQMVNDKFNALPWIADKNECQSEDDWATPLETIARIGGDCEDMAIGKFMALRLMGVADKNLYLGYVKSKKTNKPHMVLVWLNDERSDSRILDTFVKDVKSGKERTDLLAIYLISSEGDVIILNDDGKKRTIVAEITPNKVQKLESVKERIFENLQDYKKFNFGQPLISKSKSE